MSRWGLDFFLSFKESEVEISAEAPARARRQQHFEELGASLKILFVILNTAEIVAFGFCLCRQLC